ncbi:MAG: hypothetical protein CMP98_08770 [Gammaproteobacteria bacterium]|nr:hypothetical protein [Gammaproteobacteria bacterium]OUU09095.1 MAG: hypothetical protein CBB94_08995 [Gammaproteobacteria bacterium TMED34]
MAEVAISAHLAPFHFARFPRDATGLMLKVFQRRRQLARAVELMSSTKITLLEFAFGAGLSSHETMIRTLRRSFPVTESKVW